MRAWVLLLLVAACTLGSPVAIPPLDVGTAAHRLHQGPARITLPSAPSAPRSGPARLDPRRAALSPAAFLTTAHQVHDDRRAGWLLVGGTTVEVEIPAGAVDLLTATAALPTSRGVVTVHIDGVDADGAHHIAKRTVSSAAFERWVVPLPTASTLRVRAEGPPSAQAFLAHPTLRRAPPTDPRRVVWIGLDTTRPDHLGCYGYPRATSPHLDAFAATAARFTHAVAPAPRTRPSFRAALTGRRPLDAVGAPGLLAYLSDAGFATAGLVANPHLTPRFGFAEGADRWRLDGRATAEEQVDAALAWLRDHAYHDAGLFVHFMDPHTPYRAPGDDFERFATDPDPDLPQRLSRSAIVRAQRAGTLTDRHREQLIARYDGEIAYLDRALGRLLSAIDDLPGRTLIVLHSDHGEELWDRGGFEHNHSLAPEVVDAAVLLRRPGQREGRVIDAPIALDDLLPTILDLLGLPHDGFDGQSLRPALDGHAMPARPRGVAHLMYDTERWSVRAHGHRYALHTASGTEELYDRAADPEEQHDLVAQGVDPSDYRALLAQAHGAQVGPGWRVAVALDGPVRLDLPHPAVRAGVIDPEASRAPRTNQVWGQIPPVIPPDVATVTLSADGRQVHIAPGSVGEGLIFVRFEEPIAVSGVVEGGSAKVALVEGEAVEVEGSRLTVRAGTLIEPPLGEAARLRAVLDPSEPPADHHLKALRALGYLHDDP